MANPDYVIVGAGSAGCVLANRLSADAGSRVLLLEAGGKDRSLNIRIPAAFPKQFHTKLDWEYYTEPEPELGGRSLFIPRGKTLGGSSSMNAMLYVRGRPLDYDLWVEQGAPGWGWDDVLPYFLRSEDNVRGASEFHGAGGEVKVCEQRSPRPLGRRIIDAWTASGTPYVEDYNGPEQDGVTMFQVFQNDGRRWSTADAFLRPVLGRDNLEVVTGATVLGLELDGNRVTGVRYRRGRRGETVVRPEGEVILSAGAIGSPQILQLSGIGDPDELRAVGVEPRHVLPGVGRNLQDHPYITLLWEIAGAGPTLYGAEKPKFLLEWLLRKTGPLTSTAAEVGAFVRSRPGLPAPDLEFHMGALYFEKNGEEEFDGDAMTMGPVLISTRSRGRVWLRSADPTDKPRILTNTLSEPEDVAALVAGMNLARQAASETPLAEVVVRELKPGPDVQTPEQLDAALRERVELLYHPSGTCRMSDTADDAVVDSNLRVHGLEGVRVVDASIFPLIPGGNTNAPTIMVAERASDLIRGVDPLRAASRSGVA